MFVTKQNRIQVYKFLFSKGTLVAKKDYYQQKHSEEIPIHNLEVIGVMRSMVSKGFAKETYNWRYYYYVLTPEGVEYLRSYLALPESMSPATYTKTIPAKVEEDAKAAPEGEFAKEKKDAYRN